MFLTSELLTTLPGHAVYDIILVQTTSYELGCECVELGDTGSAAVKVFFVVASVAF